MVRATIRAHRCEHIRTSCTRFPLVGNLRTHWQAQLGSSYTWVPFALPRWNHCWVCENTSPRAQIWTRESWASQSPSVTAYQYHRVLYPLQTPTRHSFHHLQRSISTPVTWTGDACAHTHAHAATNKSADPASDRANTRAIKRSSLAGSQRPPLIVQTCKNNN